MLNPATLLLATGGLCLLAALLVPLRAAGTRANIWAVLLGLVLMLAALSLGLHAMGHERLLPVGFGAWAMLPVFLLPLGVAVANIGLLRQFLLFFNLCLGILALGLVYWLYTQISTSGGGLSLPAEGLYLGVWAGALLLAALFDALLQWVRARTPGQQQRLMTWVLVLLLFAGGWSLDLAAYMGLPAPALGIPLFGLGFLVLAGLLLLHPGPRKISGTITPAIIQESKQAVLIADGEGRVQAANRAAMNILSKRRYQVLGKDIAQVLGLDVEYLDSATRLHGAGFVERIKVAVKSVKAVREVAVQPLVLRAERGEVLALICTLNPGAEDPGLAATSLKDPVTGLPGAALGEALLQQELRRHSGGGGPLVAAIFLRLDDTAAAVQRHGQALHDRLQNAVVERLQAVCDWPVDLARSAGGGFLLLLTQVNDRDEVLDIAGRARELLTQPFKLDDKTLEPPVFLAVLPDLRVYHDLVDLLADSRHGLEQARHEDSGFFVVEQRARDRVSLALGLEAAISTDALELQLEPVIDIQTQAAVGARVRVIWQPEGMPPLQDRALRRLARRVHLEGPLNQWRIRQLARAPLPKGWTLWLPVDVEDLQEPAFVKGFPQAVTRLPFLLALELPEAAWMQPSVRKQLAMLSENGIGLHAQQFAAGAGMLTHAAGLQARSATLEPRLVQSHSPATDAWVSGLVATSRVLGARLRAEGVRKPADLRRLLDLEVELACGEFFSTPLSLTTVEAWLQNGAGLKQRFKGLAPPPADGRGARRSPSLD